MPGHRVLEGIGEDAFNETGHRDLPTNPLMVENADQCTTNRRRVVCESCHVADFLRTRAAKPLPSIDHTGNTWVSGEGVPERRNPSPRPISTRNLGIIHWKRAFRLFHPPAGRFFSATVKSQLLREVMNMNPAQIVALALQAAAAVITEVVSKKK